MGSNFSSLYADETPQVKGEVPEVKAAGAAVCGDDEKDVERATTSGGTSDSTGLCALALSFLPTSSSSASVVSDTCLPEMASPPEAPIAVAALLRKDLAGPWMQEDYEMVKSIQPAAANHGRVELMRSVHLGGRFVAVKKMPNRWVRKNQDAFSRKYPTSPEQPWMDIAVMKYLHQLDFPYVCEPLGLFRDRTSTYVVSTYAEFGDLYSCLFQKQFFPMPGKWREAMVWPLVHQVLLAVKRLHEVGIAHRDLSTTNVVLANSVDGLVQCKLIDFGSSSCDRFASRAYGKFPYMAPEMHQAGKYDSFITDMWAVGVMIFAIVSGDYPWADTRPAHCHHFDCVKSRGFRGRLSKRCISADSAETLGDLLSPPLWVLLDGMLQIEIPKRLTLGRICADMASEALSSRTSWLKEPPTHFERSPFCLPSRP